MPSGNKTARSSDFINEIGQMDVTALSRDELQAAFLKLKEEVKNGRRKAHVYGTTNPLKFPPSNKEVFLIDEPFVKLVKSSSVDTVRESLMDKEVLAYAISKMLSRTTMAEASVCKSRTSEMAYHQSFLSGCWYLTTPSPTFAKRLRMLGIEKLTVPEEEDEELPDSYPIPYSSGRAGDQAGLIVEPLTNECKLNVQSHVQETDTEEAAEEEPDMETASTSAQSMDGTPEIGRKDFSVKVWVTELNEWITVLCIEGGKEPLTVNGMYQALAYACKEGLINLEKGRVAPIYVQQWSRHEWKYGLIDIYGAVTLKEGRITAESYKEFCEQQVQRWKHLGKDSAHFQLKFTIAELEKTLASRQQWMRAKCGSDPNVTYPNKQYVVANAFIDAGTYGLPDLDQEGGVFMPHPFLFYESLLKTIIGPKVLKWTKEDVDRALATRVQALEDMSAAVLTKRQRLH